MIWSSPKPAHSLSTQELAQLAVEIIFGISVANCLKKKQWSWKEVQQMRSSPNLKTYLCPVCCHVHFTSQS